MTLVIIVLSLFTMFAFVALAVDVGYLVNTRLELQRCADAASMAAMWQYGSELSDNFSDGDDGGNSIHTEAAAAANAEAIQLALDNRICGEDVTLPGSDITWGRLSNFSDPSATLDTSADSATFNAVRVVVRRAESTNGRIPLFFAQVLGYSDLEADASATAALVRNIKGFEPPSDGSNLGILPIALDLETWLDLLDGIGDDDWNYDKQTKALVGASDGVPEANLYPSRKGGAPGNRGTVDIGSSGNSTNDIKRQILHGVSAADLAHIGGVLELNGNGELLLNGDTGISAGIKSALASRIGDTFTIPIFSKVTGPGNNAEYTIVRFAGIRLLDVNLTGSQNKKRVTIQPATISMKGVVPATDGDAIMSDFVFSSVFIAK